VEEKDDCRALVLQVQQIRQQLGQQLLPAVVAAAAAPQLPSQHQGSSSSSSSRFGELSEHVEAFAQQVLQWSMTFCGHFATSCCCNNPACANMASSSEQELVGGKKCVCSRCVTARYCSKECQKAVWPYHKQNCKRMKRKQRQKQQQQQQQEEDENDLLQQQDQK
jgi:hypothetical protein